MSLHLSPVRRRLVYALSFEGIGLVISTLGLMLFSGQAAATAAGASAGTMLIALAYIVQVQAAAWYVKLTDRLFGAPPATPPAAAPKAA